MAHVVVLGLVERRLVERAGGGPLLLAELLGEVGEDLVLDHVEGGVAGVLLVDREGAGELGVGDLLDRGEDLAGDHQGLGLALGLPDLGDELLLELDEGLDRGLARLEGLDHGRLVDLVGAALDHHDGVLGGGDEDVEVGLGALGVGGVDHQLTVDAAHPAAGDGAAEGDVAHAQGRRGAGERQVVRVVLSVEGEDADDDLGLVVPAVGEERADGAVDDAGEEGLPLGGPALAAEERAGDAAAAGELLLVVHRQGQERDVLGILGGVGVDEDGGVAVAHHHRARRLLGVAAGVEGELELADLRR